MAVDAFIWFVADTSTGCTAVTGETTDKTMSAKKAFEIKEFSFDVENPSTIGSGTSGAGGGKIKFNEFTIKKTTDKASPAFFLNCVTGVHYDQAVIAIRKAGGGGGKGTGAPFLYWSFNTVFTTKIEWSGPGDEEGPEESITFAYGKLGCKYIPQDNKGALTGTAKMTGWDQQQNQQWGVTDTDFS